MPYNPKSLENLTSLGRPKTKAGWKKFQLSQSALDWLKKQPNQTQAIEDLIMTAETTTTVKTFKVRKISKNTEADYPTQRIEAETLLSAGQQYCKINDFGKAIDFLHSSDDVYTLLSSNKSANVIGKFQIYEI